MNSLYTLGVRQTSSIQADLEKMTGGEYSTALQGQIAASLSALSRTADNLDTMAKREAVQAKQDKAHMRAQKFRSDYSEFKSQFDRLKVQGSNERQAAQRSELLQSSSGTPMTSDTRRRVIQSSSSGTSESPFQNASGGNAHFRENQALHEHTSLHNIDNTLDDFIAQGRAVLDNLTDQRDIMKGAHRRILDAANTLSLSRDVIGWIERRSKQDMYIFFGGALLTLVAFYYIWKWFG